MTFRARHTPHPTAGRFAASAAAKRNVATAETFLAHAKGSLMAGRQMLRRAEAASPGLTGNTVAMLTLVIEQVESLQQGGGPPAEPVAKDEEE